MQKTPRCFGKLNASALSFLCVATLVTPCAARDDFKSVDVNDRTTICPIDVQMRVANPSAVDRFQSLSGCSASFVALPGDAPSQAPVVVRITGVKEGKQGAKKDSPAKEARARKVTVVFPKGAYDNEIRSVAKTYRIDPLFLHALVNAESAYRPNAKSRVGALGLMQIMPATGAGLGVDRTALLNPAANLDAGARHLKQLQKRYGRNFSLILSAYNAGAGAVERYGSQIPPFPETRAYVTKVMQRYGDLRAALPANALAAIR